MGEIVGIYLGIHEDVSCSFYLHPAVLRRMPGDLQWVKLTGNKCPMPKRAFGILYQKHWVLTGFSRLVEAASGKCGVLEYRDSGRGQVEFKGSHPSPAGFPTE